MNIITEFKNKHINFKQFNLFFAYLYLDLNFGIPKS